MVSASLRTSVTVQIFESDKSVILSVPQYIYCITLKKSVNTDMWRMWKETVVAQFHVRPVTYVKGLKEITQTLSWQPNSGPALNTASPEYRPFDPLTSILSKCFAAGY
jgi:hypothetical protein